MPLLSKRGTKVGCPQWAPREHIREDEEQYNYSLFCNTCVNLHWETGPYDKSSEVDWEMERLNEVSRAPLDLHALWCDVGDFNEIEVTVIFQRKEVNK